MTNDIAMPMSVFQEMIATAQAAGQEWVETTPEIIKILQPRGLGGSKYFIYHGIKVCEFGKVEEIEAECDEPMTNRLHGSKEARVVSGN